MDSQNLLLISMLLCLIFLSGTWIKYYGLKRGTLISVVRLLWLVPVLCCLFPRLYVYRLPSTLSLKTIQLFIDDSISMSSKGWLKKSEKIADKIENECMHIGCKVEKKYLSDYSDAGDAEYSLLNDVLESWSYEVNQDPWIVLSDGGRAFPQKDWSNTLKRLDNSNDQDSSGLIVAFEDRAIQNLWIISNDQTVFAFEEKPVSIPLEIYRSHIDSRLQVQIQVTSGGKYLASDNFSFEIGDASLSTKVVVPSLPKGNHLIEVQVLPIANEKILWDNVLLKNVEIMSNTIGVLHLLGAPSWDGRFVRRYLKSEPKYDLISFYILRDPTDQQFINERELSLIPFPVDRLFTQELPNFSVVVIQNFSLFQFLDLSYQKNLAGFVKNGGGLLFIGGERSLSSADYLSSPLSSIIPFDVKSDRVLSNNPISPKISKNDKSGPFYDPDLEFSIVESHPDLQSRELANIYDEWLELIEPLKKTKMLKGMHHTENVNFRKGEHTPLLSAKSVDGSERPLAVASYPGKGRAIWLFSDAFWNTAMNSSVSRDIYHGLINSSMTWLLRQELIKPLGLSNFSMSYDNGVLSFDISVHGPATTYLSNLNHWNMKICGVNLDTGKTDVQKVSSHLWSIQGSSKLDIDPASTCEFELSGIHPSFGSVESTLGARFPKKISDSQSPFSRQLLTRLSALTSSKIVDYEDRVDILRWLAEKADRTGDISTLSEKSYLDHFWIWKQWWVYLLFLALPLEVVLRRWT